MNDRAVSVVVPVYNTRPYLKTCLQSILDQSLEDIEIVIVDDASSDGSREIIQTYVNEDDRVKVVTHETNQGLHIARINGVLASSGRYLAYVDSDDHLVRDALERSYSTAVDGHADIVRMSADILDEAAACDNERESGVLHFKDASFASGIEYLNTAFYPAMWLHLHHRRLWESALPYFPRIRLLGEDNLTSFVLAFFANRVISSAHVGYNYVERTTSLTGDTSLSSVRRHIQDRATLVSILRAFIAEFGGQCQACLDNVIANNKSLIWFYIRSLESQQARRDAADLFERCWGEAVPEELRATIELQ